MEKKIYALLGLCRRSGKMVSGEFSVKKAIQEGKAKLVIVSADASDGTKKLFNDKCKYYCVPIYMFGSRGELGRCIGKEERCSIAVLDQGFASGIIKHLGGGG